MSRTLQLYQLQAIDTEIDETKQQLAQIQAQLGENDAMKQAKRATSKSEQQLRQAQTAVRDLDLEVKSLVNKIASEEKKLYSGKISSPKEAANLQEEVASLKRRQAEREEYLLIAMVELEEAEETLQQAQTNLAETEAAWSAEQAELQARQANLNQTLSELNARRPVAINNIAPKDLAMYERLRPKRSGRAIALVKNGVCQGCGVEVSSSQVQKARTATDLFYCPTCGRIMYVP